MSVPVHEMAPNDRSGVLVLTMITATLVCAHIKYPNASFAWIILWIFTALIVVVHTSLQPQPRRTTLLRSGGVAIIFVLLAWVLQQPPSEWMVASAITAVGFSAMVLLITNPSVQYHTTQAGSMPLLVASTFTNTWSENSMAQLYGSIALMVIGLCALALTTRPPNTVPGTVSLRRFGVWVLLPGMILALPLAYAINTTRANLHDHPFGSLGDTVTSNAVVQKATFYGPAPTDPYWVEDFVVRPISEFQWAGPLHTAIISIPLEQPSPETDETALAKRRSEKLDGLMAVMAGTISGSSDATYTYDLNWRNRHFPLSGTTKSESIVRLGGGAYGGTIRATAYVNPKTTAHLTHAAFDALTVLPPTDSVEGPGVAPVMPRTKQMVDGWLASGLRGQALVDHTLAWMGDNLAYHFDHQSRDAERNMVDHFLFVERKGVCRQMANSFGMMMRHAGIPTRLITGFRGGSFDPTTNTWTVRARDAHVWAEVLINGQWIHVDPTNYVPVEKGVPQGTWSDAMEEWLGGKTWDDNSFDVRGGPGKEHTPQRLQSMEQWVQGALACVFVLIGVAWWVGRPKPPAPPRRAWARMTALLGHMGPTLDPTWGPATIRQRYVGRLPDSHRAVFCDLVNRYEAWRFADTTDPALAQDINRHARLIMGLVWRARWQAWTARFR